MADYSVLIEVRAPAAPDLDVEAALADLLDRLDDAGHPGPIVSGDANTWSARIFVSDEDNAVTAAQYAETSILAAARYTGLPTWPVVRAEAAREDVFDEDLIRPQIPDLVSTAEIAVMLGVTSQRVLALAASPAFPRPFISKDHAKLWVRPAVERFAETWDRTPGRAPKAGRKPKPVDEDTIRRRAVKGAAFELTAEEYAAAGIAAFLAGGDPADLAERYRKRYEFEQRLAG